MSATAIDLVVNGEAASLAAENVPELLRELGYDPEQQGVAVAVNAEVVPRSLWADRRIEAGDRIEIVGAKQGG